MSDQELILRQQEEVKEAVRNLMKEIPITRNSDTYLMLLYWQKKQFIKILVEPQDIGRMTPAESISRARRFIQNNECQLLPTDPAILVRRRVKEEILRSYYAENTKLIQEYERIRFGII